MNHVVEVKLSELAVSTGTDIQELRELAQRAWTVLAKDDSATVEQIDGKLVAALDQLVKP